MNSINIHNVTKIETVVKTIGDFHYKDLIITDVNGERVQVTLFSQTLEALQEVTEEAQVEAQEDNTKDLLLMSVKDALFDWGLEGYPQYHALVEELFKEAQRPGNDVDLGAPSLCACLTWGLTEAGTQFYVQANNWTSYK